MKYIFIYSDLKFCNNLCSWYDLFLLSIISCFSIALLSIFCLVMRKSLTFIVTYRTISLLNCSIIWSIYRYALLGAASFLGGSMRMTVSLCVIMVEITNNLKLLPLIMLVLLISKVSIWMLVPLSVSWLMCFKKSSLFFPPRLLVMLLMKAYIKNKHDWGAFCCWNQDPSTRCGKWLSVYIFRAIN